jgi:hypothetical protein
MDIDKLKKGQWILEEGGDIGKFTRLEHRKGNDEALIYAYWHGQFDNKEYEAWIYPYQLVGAYKLKREAKAVSDIIKPPKGK